MEYNIAPTKANLAAAKGTLYLSKQGYDLMDKKRSILMQEIMALEKNAVEIQAEIDTAFEKGYKAIREAAIDMGRDNVEAFSLFMPVDNSVGIKLRSVMGAEVPVVSFNKDMGNFILDLEETTSALDEAYLCFNRIKELSIGLAEIESAAQRLAESIKKTRKRANALKNITIPRYEGIIKDIQNILEEKEREEFTRLKVIKRNKEDSEKA